MRDGNIAAARPPARKRAVRKRNKVVRKKPRSRRGTFGIPPPPTFDLDKLPDSGLLTSDETAAVLRRSRATLPAWRADPNHELKWEYIDSKPLYRVRHLRAFIAARTEPRE